MPTANGLFDSFDNLDSVDIAAVMSWLKNPPSAIQLENYLANKIIYPQTIPLTDYDLQVDLAILREVLRLNAPKPGQQSSPLLGDNPFLNITLRKLIIPGRFLECVPNLVSLTWAFIDGLLLNRKKEDWYQDLWTVVISSESDEVVGSIILPQFGDDKDIMALKLPGKDYKIKAGSLTIIPCPKDRCEIAYKLTNGKVLGQKEAALEIYGGKLGLMIDGRRG